MSGSSGNEKGGYDYPTTVPTTTYVNYYDSATSPG